MGKIEAIFAKEGTVDSLIHKLIILVSGLVIMQDESLRIKGGIPSIPTAFLVSRDCNKLETSSSDTGLKRKKLESLI